MWTCPVCQQAFYNKNQSHSCGTYSLHDFLKSNSERSISLLRHFLYRYEEIGPYELHPVKTRVALLTKIRFASINKLGPDYLDGHLLLIESYDATKIFRKIDNLNDRFFVHHFRIRKENEVDELLWKYMFLAYGVGQREHVFTKNKKKYGGPVVRS